MNKQTYFSHFCFIIIALLFFCEHLSSQPVVAEIQDFRKRSERADSSIIDLKNSYLIVRLPSYRKKIAQFDKLINSPTVSARKKKRYERLKKRQIRARDFLHNEVAQNMYKYYDFSNFLILMDSSFDEFRAGQHKGLFLNEDLTIDDSLKFTGESYHVLRFGNTDYAYTNGRTGIVIMDKDLEDLQSPFPYFIDIYDPSKELLVLFFPNISTIYKGRKFIKKFNDQLNYAQKGSEIRASNRKTRAKAKSKTIQPNN